jgi:hypothetical protein
MWIELITSLSQDSEFSPPATNAEISAIEQSLDVWLPDDLKSLLKESDGVSGSYGLDVIWSVHAIRNRNIAQRQHIYPQFQSLDMLLFFADAGNGDLFAYRIEHGATLDNSVWVWNHENDERWIFAASLREFLELWLSGKKGV